MSKYTEFEVLLEGFLDEKLRSSYIKTVLEEGYNLVVLNVYANGSLNIFFDGNSRYHRLFKSINHFRQRSEILEELEDVGYVLVSSSVSAEKLTKGDIPSEYNVVVNITDSEVWECHVSY